MINHNIQRSAALLASLTAGTTGLMAQQAKSDLSAERNGDRPNIVIVISEDLSSRWGCFGDKVAHTPNLDALAQEGVRFTNVHTMAGVSGASRSGLITGVFQNFTNMPHMRAMSCPDGKYFATPPANIKAYPELLRRNGYFTYCDVKFDYQWTTPAAPGAFTIFDEVEDRNQLEAYCLMPRWRNYDLKGKPFFFNYNPQITHESGLFFSDDPTLSDFERGNPLKWDKMREMYKDRVVPTDPKKVDVGEFYLNKKGSRKEIARFYDNIQIMDCQVGDLIKNLKEDGLWDNTILIVTTDHGDCLPRAKREGYDSGTRVPMIMHVPAKYRPTWMPADGQTSDRLISFEDLTPTLLGWAGAPIPSYMRGIDLSKNTPKTREYVFADRGRMDNLYLNAFFVQNTKFQYVRNLTKTPNGAKIPYREHLLTMKDLREAYDKGKLKEGMKEWFEDRPVEEFYDLTKDPYELHNVINDPAYAAEIAKMRNVMDDWRDQGNDATIIPEKELRASMLDANGQQKTTLQPVVSQDEINHKVYVTNLTDYASIGYSYDGKHYDVYTKALTVPAGVDKIYVKAVRYGWKESKPVEFSIKH